MAFLLSLERGGTFPDLYGYWPPPDDPEYPWTIADTSVVNMSVIFWVLATEITDRVARGLAPDLVLDDDGGPLPPPPPPAESPPITVGPNPARRSVALKFTLAAPAPVDVTIYDAGGRAMRSIRSERLTAGEQTVSWDGLDRAGRRVPSGAYYVRIEAPGWRTVQRITYLR